MLDLVRQAAQCIVRAGISRLTKHGAPPFRMAASPNVSSELRVPLRNPAALRVECTKCGRRGVYYVHRLIEKHGRKGNMMKWRELLNGDCPRRDAHSLQERCDLVCPDLPEGALIEHPFVCVASRAFRVADVPWENPGYLCRCDTNRLSIIAGPCVLPFCDSHIASASVNAAPIRATAIVM